MSGNSIGFGEDIRLHEIDYRPTVLYGLRLISEATKFNEKMLTENVWLLWFIVIYVMYDLCIYL